MKLNLTIFLCFMFIIISCSSYDLKGEKVKKQDKKLSELSEEVYQKGKTEAPFSNKYWDNKEEGIYVDIMTGEPLFSSKDKFDSKTGWPSFTKPIDKNCVKEKKDSSHGMNRTEVRSLKGEGHLGHVFEDGPKEKGGMRYCINSASLKFISKKDLTKEGYEEYMSLFEDGKKITDSDYQKATFAAGCFWGVENILKGVKGVISTIVGYTGGNIKNPTYEDVITGKTGHAESVQVLFDPKMISYKELVEYFWRLHDPTQPNRQENDVGTQYRSAIFYHSEEQKEIAIKSRAEFDNSGVFQKKAVTEIVDIKEFYPAEDYHQDYLEKNPEGYSCHRLRDK